MSEQQIWKLEDCEILWTNFTGKARQYNDEGKRNFCVKLTEEEAKELSDAGWPVKVYTPNNDRDPFPYMQVALNYESQYPPMIYLITGNRKVLKTESNVHQLDWLEPSDIERVDLIVRAYNWSVRGDTGIKPYVKKMYITAVPDDDFGGRYSELDDYEEDEPSEEDLPF